MVPSDACIPLVDLMALSFVAPVHPAYTLILMAVILDRIFF